MREQIRQIVEAQIDGDLATPERASDLRSSGLTSLGATRVLMDLEDHFEIEFPVEFLTRETFGSLDALEAAVAAILADAPVASR